MRIAVVAGPDPGHLFPAAALATALAASGEDVCVFTTARWLAALREAGLANRELRLVPLPGAETEVGQRLWERAAQLALPLYRELRAWGAEAVVCDTLTRCGGFAAGVAGLPWLELIPHPLADPSRSLPPFGTGWRPGVNGWRGGRDRLLRQLAASSRRLGLRQAEAALATLPPGARTPPRHRLVATLPALEPVRADWPSDATVVTPLEWDPERALLEAPPGTDPLILVSGSTAAPGVAQLGDVVRHAVAGQPVRVVETTFGAAAGPLPAACRAGRGRQEPLLAAAALVVCGGGHGMVAKALSRGLPVVCVPGGGDQKEISARVARLGAGVACAPRPDRVRTAITRVLSDASFAGAARGAAQGPAADPVQVLREVLR